MSTPTASDTLYGTIPVFRGFDRVMDRDGADAERAQGSLNPAGDLTAIGDQHFLEGEAGTRSGGANRIDAVHASIPVSTTTRTAPSRLICTASATRASPPNRRLAYPNPSRP